MKISRAPKKYDAFLMIKEVEEFLNWVVDQGCDVHQGDSLEWDQSAKFTTRRGHEGIIYLGYQGNLLAHDMIERWRKER